MARLTRVALTLFGSSGASANFGQFGSQAASSPVTTKDVALIQALAAWVQGWQDAVALNQAPYLEDMNGAMYVFCYELAYLMQEGVAEWNTSTTYYTGSVVKNLGNSGYTEFYISLVNNNTGNALPTRTTDANWQFLYARSTSGLIIGSGIVGVVDASNAPTGDVGEAIRTFVPSASSVSSPGSGQYFDVGSIALTAGDWDVSGLVLFTANGGTVTVAAGGIWNNAGNVNTNQLPGDNYGSTPPPTSAYDTSVAIPSLRVSISSPDTYYLKAFMSFSVATPKAYGRISARRVR